MPTDLEQSRSPDESPGPDASTAAAGAPGVGVTLIDAGDMTLPDGDLRAGVEEQPPNLAKLKTESAIAIARLLVFFFGATLVLGFASIIAAICKADRPEDVQAYLAGAIPMLKALGDFCASVFSPLLAFVLGYFFGERR